MVNRQKLFRVVIACAACLALPPIAWSQGLPDADTQEVNNYRLSEPALAKYTDANRRLSEVFAENPPPCDEASDESLSGMAAQLDAIPAVQAALSAAGLSSREYIVFGLAGFQAGMGAWALTEGGGELPPGVAEENVTFYQQHETEFQAVSAPVSRDDCAGEDEGDYDDDPYDDGANDEAEPDDGYEE
jgi:hypothetical protein